MTNVAAVLKPVSRPEKINTGLEDKYRKQIATKLSKILEATYQLTVKSHIYHWNVVGPLFQPLHILLEQHYNTLFQATDVVAERIRALGYLAPATMGDAKNFAPSAADVDHTNPKSMVDDLIADHEACVRDMREAAALADDNKDFVTNDMLTAHLTFHEKALWMLRAIVAN